MNNNKVKLYTFNNVHYKTKSIRTYIYAYNIDEVKHCKLHGFYANESVLMSDDIVLNFKFGQLYLLYHGPRNDIVELTYNHVIDLYDYRYTNKKIVELLEQIMINWDE